MKWLDGFCWKKSIQPFLEALKVGLKKEILITCHPTHPYDRQIRQTKGNHWIQWISWEVVQNFINRFWYYTVAMLPLSLSNSKLSTGWESDFPQPSMTRNTMTRCSQERREAVGQVHDNLDVLYPPSAWQWLVNIDEGPDKKEILYDCLTVRGWVHTPNYNWQSSHSLSGSSVVPVNSKQAWHESEVDFTPPSAIPTSEKIDHQQ